MESVGVWPETSGIEDRAKSDAALLAAGQSGDSAAIERLLSLHEDHLYALCRGIMQQDLDAEDAVQETFLRALRSLQGFRGSSQVRTWLTRIAVNVCLDRKRSRHRESPLCDSIATASNERPVEDRVVQERSVLEALAALLPRHRAMLLLKELEGWSAAELASSFRCTQRRVYHELSIAHQMLAEWRRRCDEEGD